MESPLIELHRAAGAQLAEFEGCLLPKVFSDFETEYGAGRESVALFDTNWRMIATLTGRDRVKYMHAITSNDIKSLADGQGVFALLLTPQGRILAELEIFALPEKLLVLSHASFRERTIATLRKYVIGSQVQIDEATGQLGSIAFEGPLARKVRVEGCDATTGELPLQSIRETQFQGIPCHLLRRSFFGEIGFELIARREALPELWEELLALVRANGGAPIGMDALQALRLDEGVPWFPTDFNDAMIPHEAALENTHISFTKGCYTGQEIVERVRSRGHVNRKRVSLRFSSAVPPAPGTKLRVREAEVGSVTSAAFSPRAGAPVGMGYVRREYFAPGSVVEFEGGTAEVTAP